MSNNEYKFPIIDRQFSKNSRNGWVMDACFAIDDNDIDTARKIQILAKGTKEQIKSYFDKDQRDFHLLQRIENRRQLKNQLDESTREWKRKMQQIVQDTVREAMNTPRSKRLATSSFKRDNLNQFRQYGRDKHDALLR